MKKHLMALLLLVSLLCTVLSGCGDGSAEQTPEDRAQANTARITPPARAYYVGVDLADGKDYTATARGLVENG